MDSKRLVFVYGIPAALAAGLSIAFISGSLRFVMAGAALAAGAAAAFLNYRPENEPQKEPLRDAEPARSFSPPRSETATIPATAAASDTSHVWAAAFANDGIKPHPAAATPAVATPASASLPDQVVEGRDGVLFLGGDSAEFVNQIEGRAELTPDLFPRLSALHQERAKTCGAFGAWYAHVIAPNKETVLEHYLPPQVTPRAAGPTPAELYRAAGGHFFFKPETMLQPQDAPTFLKQNSIWTTYGASHYLNEFLKETDIRGANGSAAMKSMRRRELARRGDLAAKDDTPETFTEVFNANKRKLIAYSNEVRGPYSATLYRNPDSALDLRVLVLHDRAGALFADLASMLFHETLFIQTTNFDPNFIRQPGFNGVIFIQMERGLVRRPNNRTNFKEALEKVEQARFGKSSFEKLLEALPVMLPRSGTKKVQAV